MTRREPHDRPAAHEVAGRLRALSRVGAATPPSASPAEATAVLASQPGEYAADRTEEAPTPGAGVARGHVPRRGLPVASTLDRVAALWRQRSIPLLGVRADLVVVVAATLLALFAVLLLAGGDASEGEVAPSPAQPTAPPGADRLPDDLDRLDETVTRG
jgi:hypothetical protein